MIAPMKSYRKAAKQLADEAIRRAERFLHADDADQTDLRRSIPKKISGHLLNLCHLRAK